MRILYKQYYRCSTQSDVITGVFGEEIKLLINSFTFNGVRESDGSYTSAPAWFAQVNDAPLHDTVWVITPPNEENTQYDFSWTASMKEGDDIEYIVRLTMLDYCDMDLGCDTSTTTTPLSVLTWLTREGGWCYFPFNGKKSFEVTIPDAETYQQGNYILRQTSRMGVYQGETLSTGSIPQDALDLLQSLKESIQVYYVDNPTTDEPTYYPVILQNGNFVKRKTDERRWDVNVKFIYAEERQIQSQ